jgi:hypothetical protein
MFGDGKEKKEGGSERLRGPRIVLVHAFIHTAARSRAGTSGMAEHPPRCHGCTSRKECKRAASVQKAAVTAVLQICEAEVSTPAAELSPISKILEKFYGIIMSYNHCKGHKYFLDYQTIKSLVVGSMIWESPGMIV